MSAHQAASVEWHFTRPDPLRFSIRYFRDDLRKIAGMQADWNLPWQNDMYLAYPSADDPDWTAFVAHVKQLNEEADANASYKIMYIIRRAHKESGDEADPSIDATGKKQCRELAASLERAMQDTSLPPPDAIVTSPLTRAMETTMLALAPLFPSIRPVVLESLREQLNGAEKNKRRGKEWIEHRFPAFDTTNVDAENPLETTYADIKEPYEDLWPRVKGAFQYIFEAFPDGLVIALVSHCYVMKAIQREITGYDIPEEDRTDKVQFFVGEVGVYAITVKGENRRMLREE